MLMQDKIALVTGVSNHRSIAWAIARALDREGAQLVLGYLGDREKQGIGKIVDQLQRQPLLVACDVTEDDSVGAAFETIGESCGRLDCLVHSIAFAHREDLDGRYTDTSRQGYHLALDVSSYSLNCLVQGAEHLMTAGGGVVAMTYLGSERAVANYNVMGVAKAALEFGRPLPGQRIGHKRHPRQRPLCRPTQNAGGARDQEFQHHAQTARRARAAAAQHHRGRGG